MMRKQNKFTCFIPNGSHVSDCVTYRRFVTWRRTLRFGIRTCCFYNMVIAFTIILLRMGNCFHTVTMFSLTRYYLNIDMFGKDLALARQQFLYHLQRHTATLKGHVMCQMFLDPPLWKAMAEFCHNTLSVELVKEYTEQCVVECDLI